MAADADTGMVTARIRTDRHVWALLLMPAAPMGIVGVLLLVATPRPHLLLAGVELVVAAVLAGESLLIRSFGVDLTPTYAIVRTLRLRRVELSDITRVEEYNAGGARALRLILTTGKPVNLRAPTTWGRFGLTRFQRDADHLYQWVMRAPH